MQLKLDQQKRIDLTPAQLQALLAEFEKRLEPEQFEIVRAVFEMVRVLSQAVDQKSTSIAKLLRTMFGATSEKTRNVIEDVLAKGGTEHTPEGDGETPAAPDEKKKRKPGHGRNGADKYTGAQRISVALESPRVGQRCPACGKGNLYPQTPAVIVRVVGQAPLSSTVWEMERVRCSLCGKLFTAPKPPEARGPKYDEAAGAMVALLRYEAGVPHNRLEMLQDGFGIPLAASTQWEIVEGVAGAVHPAYRELRRQGAQGEVIHNDDTPAKVLSLMGERGREARLTALLEGTAKPDAAEGREGEETASASGQAPPGAPRANNKKERTGVQTTAIVSMAGGHTIALYATGPRHAGENLAKLLEERDIERGPAIQMCDALSRNAPKPFQTLLAHCLVHGRRNFVDVVDSFPEECRRVLLALRDVYHHDDHCRQGGLSAEERLAYHQEHSEPVMKALKAWMDEQLDARLVEPNSGLGKAIQYMQNHWTQLTLFLSVPKAPLDNNICERTLKSSIRYRKNSLFFKNEYGAAVGDIFMSLIHTCKLAKVGAFDYLVQLQKHTAQVRQHPAEWMPWNYQATLASQQPPSSNQTEPAPTL